MTVVFGLGTRLRVRMRTTLENGVLRNEQLSGSTVNNFFDQGNFEAMKTLSGWEAARCDEHQFRAKIKVSTRAFWSYHCFKSGLNKERKKERMRKMALSLPHTFAFSCLPRSF